MHHAAVETPSSPGGWGDLLWLGSATTTRVGWGTCSLPVVAQVSTCGSTCVCRDRVCGCMATPRTHTCTHARAHCRVAHTDLPRHAGEAFEADALVSRACAEKHNQPAVTHTSQQRDQDERRTRKTPAGHEQAALVRRCVCVCVCLALSRSTRRGQRSRGTCTTRTRKSARRQSQLARAVGTKHEARSTKHGGRGARVHGCKGCKG